MERISRHKPLALAAVGALILSGCSSGENNNVAGDSYPLGANQRLYTTEDGANLRREPCAVLTQDTEVTPASVRDVGGYVILQITKSDISDRLTDPDACSGNLVYTTFK